MTAANMHEFKAPVLVMPQEKVSIEGYDVEKITYKSQPVITFKMMDQVHERPAGTASRNFRQNRERFIANEDFFRASYENYQNLTYGRYSSGGPDTGQRNPIILLTATGYMMLVKSFTDDRAWKVQRALSRSYFVNNLIPNNTASLNRQAKSIQVELKARKASLAMEKQASAEARAIFRGQGNLEALGTYPQLQAATLEVLENLKKNPVPLDDGILFRLNAVVDAHIDYLTRSIPGPDLKFSHGLDGSGMINEVSFISPTRDIIAAFNWLQKYKGILNPYSSPTMLAAGFLKVFKKSVVLVPGWQFESRIKITRGLHFHSFIKSIGPSRR